MTSRRYDKKRLSISIMAFMNGTENKGGTGHREKV